MKRSFTKLRKFKIKVTGFNSGDMFEFGIGDEIKFCLFLNEGDVYFYKNLKSTE
jgi:hypothetical protein